MPWREGLKDASLVLLSLVAPPLAVLFKTNFDFDFELALNVVLTFFWFIPGVLHALYVVFTYKPRPVEEYFKEEEYKLEVESEGEEEEQEEEGGEDEENVQKHKDKKSLKSKDDVDIEALESA